MLPILKDILEAHGKLDRFNSYARLEAELSASGFLFRNKGVAPMHRVWVRADLHRPWLQFLDFPHPGAISEFRGNGEVVIFSHEGEVVARREKPRAHFGWRQLFSWDDLDFIYFAGYATWNYLMTPFLFSWPDVHVEPLDAKRTGLDYPVALRVRFPDDIPTHCPLQTFYFDEQLLLRRLDYTAEVVGRFAHAAHLCDDYQNIQGLHIPTKRRVYPLPFGKTPLPRPLLVELDLHQVRAIAVTENPTASSSTHLG